MGKEAYSISDLASQTKNIGYYAGLTFGFGYILTMVGSIALFLEIMIRSYDLIPGWYIAAIICLILGMICGIFFGLSVIRTSKSARDSGFKTGIISSSVFVFSVMLIFMGVSGIIIATELDLSLVPPVCGVVGAILLLIGFRSYKVEAAESKLTGAILMLVSVALIYFVSYGESLLAPSTLFMRTAGPLFSELGLEAITLLIVIVFAVVFAFPVLGKELKPLIAGIILSISGILFSCGVMLFNFSTASDINNVLSLVGVSGLLTTDSIWIMFFGFLLLGISGIIALITAILPLAVSVKELSSRLEAPKLKAPDAAPPKPRARKPTAEVKYCTKCGASMPLDAVYCLKCGHKQPKT